MSNWAAYKEQEIGLPVFKRAKHGLHFKRPDGQIQAEFVGKPCHYLDAGLWKPIDTKLVLLPDGFYGCPHSPVRVHSDGRVKVEGTDYVQQVALPSPQTGLADGDKLIREFSFGKQEMRITECGFKSEITLNRIPTLTEARKFIASESGTLSKEYLKSLTTATDANGDVHTFSTLTAFRTWLASAVFPVVIDPDFNIGNTNYGDTVLCGGHTTRKTYNYGAFTLSEVYSAPTDRVLMRFDVTSIGSGSTCTASTLKLYHAKKNTDSREGIYTAYSVAAANTDWIEGTQNDALAASGSPCWNARKADGSGGVTDAWAGAAGLATSGTDYEAASLGTVSIEGTAELGVEMFIDLTTTRVGQWFGTPNTNYGLLIIQSGYCANQAFGLSEHATSGYRPVLTVTYTAGGGGYVPTINMVGQMQNLDGLRG